MLNDLIALGDADSQNTGAIIWWRLEGDAQLGPLTEAWTDLDLSADVLPNAPSGSTALNHAMQAFAERNLLKRHTRDGIVLMRESENPDASLSYQEVARTRLVGNELRCEGSLCEQVREKFDYFLTVLTPREISAWLSNVVLPMLQGVALRDRGGIYYVPAAYQAKLQAVFRAIRGTTKHQMFLVPALPSSEAVAAISDALDREVLEMVEQYSQELTDKPDMSPRVLRNRSKALLVQAEKVAMFEASLQTSLASITARLERLNTQIAIEIITAEVKADEGIQY